jgi:hypothetical protein
MLRPDPRDLQLTGVPTANTKTVDNKKNKKIIRLINKK